MRGADWTAGGNPMPGLRRDQPVRRRRQGQSVEISERIPAITRRRCGHDDVSTNGTDIETAPNAAAALADRALDCALTRVEIDVQSAACGMHHRRLRQNCVPELGERIETI